MTVDGKMVTAQQRDFFHLTSKPKKENHKIKTENFLIWVFLHSIRGFTHKYIVIIQFWSFHAHTNSFVFQIEAK